MTGGSAVENYAGTDKSTLVLWIFNNLNVLGSRGTKVRQSLKFIFVRTKIHKGVVTRLLRVGSSEDRCLDPPKTRSVVSSTACVIHKKRSDIQLLDTEIKSDQTLCSHNFFYNIP